MNANPLADITRLIRQWRGVAADLYWCPHCGYMITQRVRRDDLITACWGGCLELYGEPIPLAFVRGLGPGRPASEMPF